jgi:hypothetical protein
MYLQVIKNRAGKNSHEHDPQQQKKTAIFTDKTCIILFGKPTDVPLIGQYKYL